jgi:hypothetical protein
MCVNQNPYVLWALNIVLLLLCGLGQHSWVYLMQASKICSEATILNVLKMFLDDKLMWDSAHRHPTALRLFEQENDNYYYNRLLYLKTKSRCYVKNSIQQRCVINSMSEYFSRITSVFYVWSKPPSVPLSLAYITPYPYGHVAGRTKCIPGNTLSHPSG